MMSKNGKAAVNRMKRRRKDEEMKQTGQEGATTVRMRL